MAGKNKSVNDSYVSQAVFRVAESAANTLTFEKLETGLSVFDKIGWVISRVEYRLEPGSYSVFNAAADRIDFALTMTNSLTALVPENPSIYFMRSILRVDIGTAASGFMEDNTLVADYSGLPGGGILVLPSPIYFGLVGTSLTAAATMVCRIFFQAIEMTDQDYFNLVQARQLLIST